MLKEQVAKIDYMWRFCGIPDEYEAEWEKEGELAKQNCRAFAQEVIDLFKAEVDKLTVIDDEDIRKVYLGRAIKLYGVKGGTQLISQLESLEYSKRVAQAQLRHTKKQLLEGLEEG